MHIKAGYILPDVKIGVIERIGYEIQLSWLFIKSDLSSTMVPTFLFMLAAWDSHSRQPHELVTALASGLLYFWLYTLTFCLSNQLVGIDEDRINKPHRPLVSGIVSYYGGLTRWFVLMGMFTLVGWWLGLLGWTLLWQATLVLHNLCGWSRHWFGKQSLMGIGVIAGLAPAWELVAPLTSDAWRWIVLLASVVLPLIATQDLRDIAGDRAIGRKTLPIAFGELPTRLMLGCGFALLPGTIYVGLMLPAGHTWGTILCSAVLTAISLCIAVRLLMCRSRRADHWTYILFTYWYCMMMISAIVVL